MHPLTILLLSGGGHTGTNVMASLATRREGLRLVATSDTPDEPSLFTFDAVYLAPTVATDAIGFESRVLAIIARENPDLVVPCRDEDVQWLAGLRERRHDLAAKFLCGAHAIAVTMNDKWLSSEFSRMHHLPFVPSLQCAGGNEARDRVDAFVRLHGLPLVAKPRHGVDSQGIDILTTAAQALRAMQRPGYVLQKYLGVSRPLQDYLTRLEQDGIPLFHTFQGVKRSLQVLIGPDGNIEHVVCTRNQMIRHNARSISVDSEAEPRQIGDHCARVFAGAGWRGPLNIQCQPSATGELMIHEFNARFTGATASRWHLGHDEIGAAIHAFTGRATAPAFPFSEAPAGAMEGLWPRAADRRHVRTLAERGEWIRARE
jgi:carbamoylphosphate synthase large subunit